MNIQELWWSTPFAKYLKKRRIKQILNIIGDIDEKELKILDVGCANGKDFIQNFKEYPNLHFTGIDIDKYEINQRNCTYIQADAQEIPFEDKYFDIVISTGVLEHITPIEKLCDIVSEIDRVGKQYCITVPCINTFFEPHVKGLFWQLKSKKWKKEYTNAPLNYFSDEAWLSFKGFRNAKSKRFQYMPLVKTDLIIYSDKEE